MEFMSGSNAIGLLREFENQNKIKPLFIASLTAFNDDETQNYIIKCGADIVITKPISMVQINELMEIYLEAKI